MTDPNDTQVAGTHYHSDYQHWDLVDDLKLPYLLGCATKYIVRWRSKNGVEDLEKACHYLEKADSIDLSIIGSPLHARCLNLFCILNNTTAEESTILYTIYESAAFWCIDDETRYTKALELINDLITKVKEQEGQSSIGELGIEEGEPGPAYVNQG